MYVISRKRKFCALRRAKIMTSLRIWTPIRYVMYLWKSNTVYILSVFATVFQTFFNFSDNIWGHTNVDKYVSLMNIYSPNWISDDLFTIAYPTWLLREVSTKSHHELTSGNVFRPSRELEWVPCFYVTDDISVSLPEKGEPARQIPSKLNTSTDIPISRC